MEVMATTVETEVTEVGTGGNQNSLASRKSRATTSRSFCTHRGSYVELNHSLIDADGLEPSW